MTTPYDLGWGDPRRGPFPTVAYDIGEGVRLNVRNEDAGTVFRELVRRLMVAGWDGPKDPALDDWGANRRLKRWAEALGHTMTSAPLGEFSDHSWATAIDLDTIPNPMLSRRPADPWAQTNMPRNTEAICRDLGIEWGGTWTEPWDPQHFQLAMTPAQTAAKAREIRAGQENDTVDKATEDRIVTRTVDGVLNALRHGGVLTDVGTLRDRTIAPQHAETLAAIRALAPAKPTTPTT